MRGTKRPREQEKQVSRTQGTKRLLATQDAVVADPVAVEEVPAPSPMAAAPVGTVDALGIAGVAPVREDE